MRLLSAQNDFLRPEAKSADATKSREEKALLTIEGKEDGLFTFNPWQPVLDFDSSIVEAIARGGAAVALRVEDPTDLFDSDTERLAFLWDDEKLAGPVVTVTEGSELVIVFDEVKGQRLTAWCTDNVPVRITAVGPSSQAGELRSGIAQREKDKDATPGPLDKILATLGGTQKVIGVTVVVAGAVFLWFYLGKKGS